jgi:hypothetical protein
MALLLKKGTPLKVFLTSTFLSCTHDILMFYDTLYLPSFGKTYLLPHVQHGLCIRFCRLPQTKRMNSWKN